MGLPINNFRQRLLTPFSLYIGQMISGWVGRVPVITEEQADTIKPLFIIGAGRSGTTLVRKILLNHPDIDIPPETLGSLPNAIKKFYRYRGTSWEDMVGIIGSEFYMRNNFHLWETDIFNSLTDIKEIPKQERSLALIIHAIYKAHIDKHKPAAKIWGDKSPFNTLRLKWLNRTFPKSKFINIIRDGRDVSYSLLKADLFNTLEDSARRWNESINCAESFRKKISPDRFLSTRYEDLVNDPESVTREICDFVGIGYTKNMVTETPDQMTDVNFYDHYSNVRNDINKGSIGKWRELDGGEIDLLEKIMYKNLDKYNYLSTNKIE